MLNRMKELCGKLIEANHAYYNENREIMSNYEYDALYDELADLEEKTGTVLAGSPTIKAGAEVVSKLQKDTHEQQALSLDKTKDKEVLKEWLGDSTGHLSIKYDGLTIVCTYDDGNLIKAVTRGNSEVGEVITHNAKFIKGLPLKISYRGHLVTRGEAIITYSEFERINSKIPDITEKYKNPRNLASGTVRQLDSGILRERTVIFKAFTLVNDSKDFPDLHQERLKFLEELGFDTARGVVVKAENLIANICLFEKIVQNSDIPSDGLVLVYDSIQKARNIKNTSKYDKSGMAFKWKDETAETTLREIEWSATRTGIIAPVAVFDPVSLEGTGVSRATLHNLSIMKKLEVGIGCQMLVYKANMIIPSILKVTKKGKDMEIPDTCPSCSAKTAIKKNNDSEILTCPNPDCAAKNIGKFVHFVSKPGMNIEGLSEATLEKLIDRGFVKSFNDLYHLNKHKDEICSMEGLGDKSYENLISSVEKSRTVKFSNFLYSFGIAGVGKDVSKQIGKELGLEGFMVKLLNNESFCNIEGIGDVINNSIHGWKKNTSNMDGFNEMVKEVTFVEDNVKEVAFIEDNRKENTSLKGQIFVITGSIDHFKNRDEMKEYIEQLGGKTSGSVSVRTDYLINNDIASNSSKNKKAKELGVKIITEEQFLEMVQ